MKELFKLTDSQTNLDTMSDLYQTVIADLNLGRKMPAEFTETDLKNLKHMNDIFKTLISTFAVRVTAQSYKPVCVGGLLIQAQQAIEHSPDLDRAAGTKYTIAIGIPANTKHDM